MNRSGVRAAPGVRVTVWGDVKTVRSSSGTLRIRDEARLSQDMHRGRVVDRNARAKLQISRRAARRDGTLSQAPSHIPGPRLVPRRDTRPHVRRVRASRSSRSVKKPIGRVRAAGVTTPTSLRAVSVASHAVGRNPGAVLKVRGRCRRTGSVRITGKGGLQFAPTAGLSRAMSRQVADRKTLLWKTTAPSP
jgi:hypothetical protein